MGIHLTPLDAAFLELEEADDSAHMHIGWAMVFDPPPGASARRWRSCAAARASASGRCPASGAASRAAGRGASLPEWVADEEFDVADQMRRATLPAPGGEEELMEWLGTSSRTGSTARGRSGK